MMIAWAGVRRENLDRVFGPVCVIPCWNGVEYGSVIV